MKIALLLVMAATLPLSAQYGPPAKDLEEASFYVREITRQIEPAITEARDQAEVFETVSRATNRLAGVKPAEELAAAIKIIDDYLERRERRERPLSRENERSIASVRKELELAQPPYAIGALRERLHHEFVHNLERQALRNLARLEALELQWTNLRARLLDPCEKDILRGVRETAKELTLE
ncbi:MAG TPA: hypothetical protein VF787_12875 [Thermoanaerobaculia bacterium]